MAESAKFIIDVDSMRAMKALASIVKTFDNASQEARQFARDAVASLGKVASEAKKTDSSLSGIKSTLGGLAIGATLTSVGTSALRMGSDMEQAQIALNGLVGDAKAAKSLMGDFQKFADYSPFDTAQVVQAGKGLKAAGVESRSLMATLQTLGDISAGSGKDLVELTRIHGKAVSNQRVDSETLNQLLDSGIPIMAAFQRTTGKGALEIRKMAENGQLGVSDLIRAYVDLTKEGGIYNNAMQAQSQTTAGLWSTLYSQFQAQGVQAFQAVQPYLNSFIQTGIEYLPKVASAFGTVASTIGKLAPFLITAGAAWVGFSAGTNIASIATAIATRQVWSLNAAFAANPIGFVVAGLAALAAGIAYAYNSSEQFRSKIWGLWFAAKSVFKGIWDSAKQYLGGVGHILQGIFTMDWKVLKQGLGEAFGGVKGMYVDTARNAYHALKQGEQHSRARDAQAAKKQMGGVTAAFQGLETEADKGKHPLAIPVRPGHSSSAVGHAASIAPRTVNLHIAAIKLADTVVVDASKGAEKIVKELGHHFDNYITSLLADTAIQAR